MYQHDGSGSVRVNGAVSEHRLSTAGHDVPLRQALERIVPADYSINLPNAGAWAEMPVSWHARESFVAALREVLSASPLLSAQVDANLRLVTVRAQTLPFGEAAPVSPGMNTQPSAKPPFVAVAAASAAAAAAGPQPKAALAQAPVPAAADAPAARTAVTTTPTPPTPPTPTHAPVAPPATQAAASAAQAAHTDVFPVPPAEVSRKWELRVADRTVKNALARWAKEASWQLVWDVPVDFSIDADATVTGTFEEALQSAVHALDKSDTPVQAILYRGNKVLRIVARGAAS